MDAIQEAIDTVETLRKRITNISEDAMDLLFREARTHNAWTNKPVTDAQLLRLYKLVINGSTSGNCLPARFVYCRTPEAKSRLIPCVNPGNVAKIEAAPVCVIIGYDTMFWELLPRLFPHRDMTAQYRDNAAHAENGSLPEWGHYKARILCLEPERWAWILAQCLALTIKQLMKNSLLEQLSNRISCAISVMAIRLAYSKNSHVSILMKFAT